MKKIDFVVSEKNFGKSDKSQRNWNFKAILENFSLEEQENAKFCSVATTIGTVTF